MAFIACGWFALRRPASRALHTPPRRSDLRTGAAASLSWTVRLARRPHLAKAVGARRSVARRSRDSRFMRGKRDQPFPPLAVLAPEENEAPAGGEREPDRIKFMPGFELRGAADRAGRMSRHTCRRKAPRARRCILLRNQARRQRLSRDRRSARRTMHTCPRRLRIGTTPGRHCKPTGSENPTERSACRGFELRGSADGRRKSGRRRPRKLPRRAAQPGSEIRARAAPPSGGRGCGNGGRSCASCARGTRPSMAIGDRAHLGSRVQRRQQRKVEALGDDRRARLLGAAETLRTRAAPGHPWPPRHSVVHDLAQGEPPGGAVPSGRRFENAPESAR